MILDVAAVILGQPKLHPYVDFYKHVVHPAKTEKTEQGRYHSPDFRLSEAKIGQSARQVRAPKNQSRKS